MQELPLEDTEVWRKQVTIKSDSHSVVYAASGKGKTSLLNIIYGLRQDYEGDVLIDGRSLKLLKHRDWVAIRRKKIAYVPQGLWLFDHLTGIENILLKNRITNHLQKEQIQEYLKQAGMYAYQHQEAGTLSFGQQQRIAIIRALCQPFQLIMLDEAFSHLDATNRAILMQIIRQEAAEQNAGILLSSLHKPENEYEQVLKL